MHQYDGDDDDNGDYTFDEEADMNVNPFQRGKRNGRYNSKKTSKGLYNNVPTNNDNYDDYENGSRKHGEQKFSQNEDDRLVLPINRNQCRFLVLMSFLLASLTILFVRIGQENNLSPLKESNDYNSTGLADKGYEPNTSTYSGEEEGKLEEKSSPTLKQTSSRMPFHYSHMADPFHISSSSSASSFEYASLFSPPSEFVSDHDQITDGNTDKVGLGYLSYPSIFNNTLVFISEGDLYISSISKERDESTPNPAVKLTQTVGNILTPKINPRFPYLVAFSATYSSNRELYLFDLRQKYRQPAQRLTYTPNGIRHVIGWTDDGNSILFSKSNDNVGMPNTKIYQIPIADMSSPNSDDDETDDSSSTEEKLPLASLPSVGSVNSLPLAQAVDGVMRTTIKNKKKNKSSYCIYFIRFKQSSNTFRYMGGTAESLWGFCESHDNAIQLLEYRGTTRSPQIYQDKYLLFISDRSYTIEDKGEITSNKPTTLNLFAIPLPTEIQMYSSAALKTHSWNPEHIVPFQMTSISCEVDNDGRQLMEYSIDQETGNIVLRVGADFKILYANDVQKRLKKAFPKLHRKLHEDDDNSEESEPDENETGSEILSVTEKKIENDDDSIKDVEAKQKKSSNKKSATLQSTALPLALYSDFNLQQERRFYVKLPFDLTSIDIFPTIYKQRYALLGMRGQAFVSPVVSVKPKDSFTGMGEMLPPRGYKLMPSSSLGGITRVLALKHIPSNNKLSNPHALVLATDPLSHSAEHAFYVLPCDSSIKPFFSVEDIPLPIYGGHTKHGGIGSVKEDSLEVSPCGRRAAWLDTDGRVTVMTLPKEELEEGEEVETLVLPQENDRGEPMVGDMMLTWSPGGRYLAIEHSARNQFSIVSIADLSDPDGEQIENEENSELSEDSDADDEKEPKLILKQIVQATPARFNSGNVYWGRSSQSYISQDEATPHHANVLFFMTDRDIVSDVTSPWGTRAPSPHFKKDWVVYALPLDRVQNPSATEELTDIELDFERRMNSPFPTGGASELIPIRETYLIEVLKAKLEMDALSQSNSNETNTNQTSDLDSKAEPVESNSMSSLISPIVADIDIDFGGDKSLDVFARKAYRLAGIPPGQYRSILCQLSDNPTLVLLEKNDDAFLKVKAFLMDKPELFSQDYSVVAKDIDIPTIVVGGGINTERNQIFLLLPNTVKVVPNTLAGIVSLKTDDKLEEDLVDESNLVVSIFPKLEYKQMFADAWRMLRDYFYDPNMHGVDWHDVFHRYEPLVSRCAKREELDDVLAQMASELSALHVFVYGGEYEDPTHGDKDVKKINSVASLGATLIRDEAMGGYLIKEIHTSDPDFAAFDESPIYSPLSEKVMRLSGQEGLNTGDLIVAINGEQVLGVPDLHMLLRGQAGHSTRLEILRDGQNATEPIVIVPIEASKASNLRYAAWEYRTRQKAVSLAEEYGFTCGYIHLRDMDGISSIDAFTRNFFPDYDKQALIIDVRHNNGGNIDSWLLTALQRKAWGYWQGRATNITNGGLGWDEQFAFRGHLVVLVDEHTASDGEGFSRGVMELGLGKTVGMRTWGGGIWLSSDNHLVDGGIATAPEIGTYNDNYGWGLGIENMGIDPDVIVDNNPRQVELGEDAQLVKAIEVLKDWLITDPVVFPNRPGPHPDTSLRAGSCTTS